jgi:hypothetical protein
MKHMVTDLNDPNKPIMFSNSILGKLCFDTSFGELESEISPYTNSNELSKLLHSTHIVEPHYNIVEYCTKVVTNNCTNLVSCCCNFSLELTDPFIWTYTLMVPGTKKE